MVCLEELSTLRFAYQSPQGWLIYWMLHSMNYQGPNLYPICDMDGRLPSLSDFTNWYISSSILTHNRRKKAVISSFISTLKKCKCLRNNCWNSISTLLIMTLSMLVIRLSSSKIHQFIYLHFEKAKEHNSLWKKKKKKI